MLEEHLEAEEEPYVFWVRGLHPDDGRSSLSGTSVWLPMICCLFNDKIMFSRSADSDTLLTKIPYMSSVIESRCGALGIVNEKEFPGVFQNSLETMIIPVAQLCSLQRMHLVNHNERNRDVVRCTLDGIRVQYGTIETDTLFVEVVDPLVQTDWNWQNGDENQAFYEVASHIIEQSAPTLRKNIYHRAFVRRGRENDYYLSDWDSFTRYKEYKKRPELRSINYRNINKIVVPFTLLMAIVLGFPLRETYLDLRQDSNNADAFWVFFALVSFSLLMMAWTLAAQLLADCNLRKMRMRTGNTPT